MNEKELVNNEIKDDSLDDEISLPRISLFEEDEDYSGDRITIDYCD